MIIKFKGDRLATPTTTNLTYVYSPNTDFAIRVSTIQTLSTIWVEVDGLGHTTPVPVINERILVLEGLSYGDILGMMETDG